MDWSKTKNILIIGLILTNLVLGFYIYKSESLFNRNRIAEKVSVQEVIDILEKKNVYINMESVKYFSRLNDIEATYEQHDPEVVAKKILGSFEKVGNTYIGGKYRIEFGHDNIEMNMVYTGKDLVTKNTNIEEAKVIADNFIKMLDYYDKNMKLTESSTDGKSVTLVYQKTYKDLFLEDSYMKIVINNRNVVNFSRKWLVVTTTYDSTRNVVPPSKALFTFFDQLGYREKPMVITSVELGYRLGGDQFKTDVRSGDALPYWRIGTKSGEVFYIEAAQ